MLSPAVRAFIQRSGYAEKYADWCSHVEAMRGYLTRMARDAALRTVQDLIQQGRGDEALKFNGFSSRRAIDAVLDAAYNRGRLEGLAHGFAMRPAAARVATVPGAPAAATSGPAPATAADVASLVSLVKTMFENFRQPDINIDLPDAPPVHVNFAEGSIQTQPKAIADSATIEYDPELVEIETAADGRTIKVHPK